MIDAVVFDWGGTLTPWHSVDLLEQWRVYAQVAAPDNVEATAAAIYAAEDAAWASARDHHTSTTIEAVLAAADVAVDEAALAAYHEWWTPAHLPRPGCAAAVRRPSGAGHPDRCAVQHVLAALAP